MRRLHTRLEQHVQAYLRYFRESRVEDECGECKHDAWYNCVIAYNGIERRVCGFALNGLISRVSQ